MSSVRFAFLLLMGLLGLTIVSEQMAVAGNRFCERCSVSVHAPAVFVPMVVVEPALVVHVTETAVVAPVESEAKLVLNCPAEARVTIDGHVTHASGETRQYRLLFRGGDHKFRVGIRLRDNDEKATYESDHLMSCRRDQTIALSVTTDEMQKTPDTPAAADIAKLLKPGTVLRVTDDNKFEAFTDSNLVAVESEPSPENAEAVASPLKLAIEFQSTSLNKAQSEALRITKDVREKATRRDAAARIRKQIEDAYQIKNLEVNAAVNDSAATLAAKRLEAKKLELELNRAREVEQEATVELIAAQGQAKEAEDRVRKAGAKLKLTKFQFAVEGQTKLVREAQAEVKELEKIIAANTNRWNAAVRLRQQAEAAKNMDVDIELAREMEQTTKSELDAVTDQRDEAQEQVNKASEMLARIRDGSIPIE